VRGDLINEQRMMPVRMQIGEAERVINGRIIGAGDTNRSPYFPTSTGAAMGISVDAPLAVEALANIIRNGHDPATTLAGYQDAILGANTKLTAVASLQMSKDLSVPSHVIEHPEDLATWLERRDRMAHALQREQHASALGQAPHMLTATESPTLPADITTAPVASRRRPRLAVSPFTDDQPGDL
jgi:hypothetical protein